VSGRCGPRAGGFLDRLFARDRRTGTQGAWVSGVRSEPVEVWLINGRPARFVWRERLYTVLAIIERPPDRPMTAGGPGAASEAGAASESGAGSEAGAASEPGAAPESEADSVRARHPAGGHGERRRGDRTGWQCWLVTAAPGRNVPRATYRLCLDPEAGRWLLTRNGR